MTACLATVSRFALVLPLLGLAACGSPSRQASHETSTNEATGTPDPVGGGVAAPSSPARNAAAPQSTTAPVADASSSGLVSCAADIGAAAAAARVKICRNVSPATHPPCDAANSCAMIEDEIARSCALFDGKGAPMPGCQPAPKSMDAAAAVVQRYYSALNAHDYGAAWQQWGDDGQPNQSFAKFAAGFARTKATHVSIGKLQPGDGAAGSIYQTVPVTIDATLQDGTHQRFGGDYIVRRVNDVDGASPDQLRWHIDSARLKAMMPDP